MNKPNIRHATPELYDPKQRLVGGIVLFLLIFLLYLLLKLMLGLSVTSNATYALSERQPDEILKEGVSADPLNPIEGALASGSNFKQLPSRFIFLGMDGNPLTDDKPKSGLASVSPEQPTSPPPPVVSIVDDGTTKFFVQAASFRKKEQADNFLKKLQDKGFQAEIAQVGEYHTVRLIPAYPERSKAEELLKKLNTQMNVKGMIKRLN